MNPLLIGSTVVCFVVLFTGCSAGEAEVGKHEPLAKELVKLTNELADSLVKLQKEAGANQANALQHAENLKNAENVQALAAQVQAKAAEYEKLPMDVRSRLDAKYRVHDAIRRGAKQR